MAGFGGVAEYGITVRWDKNFLKLVRLLLERREQFALYGGVRFGGTLTLDDAFGRRPRAASASITSRCAWAPASRPRSTFPNGLARGVRTASDFLMALQLTGAAQRDSIANMQLRLPVVVIGGGLTAIDTATESLAYYVVQVEKFLDRYEDACRRDRRGRDPRRVGRRGARDRRGIPVACARDPQRAARGRAQPAARRASSNCCSHWGGVTIAYRRRLIDSPSYTLNHEEVAKALEEGVVFAEGLDAARGRGRRLRCGARASASRARRRTARAARGGEVVLSGAHGVRRGRHAAQHGARARGRRSTSCSTASTSAPATRTASRSSPRIRWPSRRAPTC